MRVFALSRYALDLKQLHQSPHTLLGYHDGVIRCLVPEALEYALDFGGEKKPMQKSEEGIFELHIEINSFKEYRIHLPNDKWIYDPYAMPLSLKEEDFSAFLEGRDYELYDKLGAHFIEIDGVQGVRFAVFAPHAEAVYLACEWNHFHQNYWPMSLLNQSGVWQIFIPEMESGVLYKYVIQDHEGHFQYRADPFAFYSEMRPNTASIVFDIARFEWSDHQWMKHRQTRNHHESPMNIYEVHLGSWKRKEGAFMNYQEIAPQLATYCKEMGFTHIEIMPITEHPLDESWGYQVTGYFAATSRFGTPEDFQFFMNYMHREGLHVILDWVGGHFPKDFFALAQFDGTHLYEYEDSQKGFHPEWNTLIFDYGKPEVANFLIASILFWANVMHLDGFRFDAVSSILYLSFARQEGQWTPNQLGGAENLEAIAFLKHLNQVLHERFPGVVTIAEEATTFPGVTQSIHEGGLGFDFKSNLGWMNDTLRYFQTEFPYREKRHDLITFYLMYAYHERYALFLSHDEVVHEKRSLISKMPGNQKEQFANLRLLYTMMMTLPGKKLIFMGGEFGQWNEWNEGEEIHWFLLNYPTHQGLKRCVEMMNHFYLNSDSLWRYDHDPKGFTWVVSSDSKSSVVAYLRSGEKKHHLVIHNFSQNTYSDYHLNLENIKGLTEVFNSEHEQFLGCGLTNPTAQYDGQTLRVALAPFVTSIYEITSD